jgi:hypothetical protein
MHEATTNQHPPDIRYGSAPPESTTPPTRVMPLYGPNGWRSKTRDKFPFSSDSGLRWFVDENRAELINRRAITMITGRVCAVLPEFEIAVIDIGNAKLSANFIAKEREFENMRIG